MSLATTVLAGVLFGLAVAAPPGPMNAIIAEESVLRGWTAGVVAGFGALSADLVFLGLAYVGVATVVERLPTLRTVMILAGGLLMLYFAYGAAKGARASFRPTDGSIPAESRGFRKAFVLALTNPFQVLFWLTIGFGMLEPGTMNVLAPLPTAALAWVPGVGGSLAGAEFVVATGSAALLGAFFCGILLWITGFPAALVAAERRMERLAPVVAAASAALLAGFGAFFLYDAGTALLA